MKKLLIYLVMLSLMLSYVFAAEVTRSMPSTVEPGSEVTVSFNVVDMEVGKSVTISDTLPSGLSLKAWSVTGATKDDVTYEVVGSEYRWEIPATATSVVLSYTLDVPTAGSYAFDAVYFAPPAKMDNLKSTLTVATTPPPAPTTPPPAPTTPTAAPTPEPGMEEEAGGVSTGVILVVLLVIVGIIVWFVMSKKKK